MGEFTDKQRLNFLIRTETRVIGYSRKKVYWVGTVGVWGSQGTFIEEKDNPYRATARRAIDAAMRYEKREGRR